MKNPNKKIIWGGVSQFLNKDIKELNGVILSLFVIIFLVTVGVISYKINSSYAVFTDSVSGEKTIEIEVCNNPVIGKDESNANEPMLSENMIPVYYDECNKVWKKADSENASKRYRWYNYEEKIWANSVTVTEETRSKYLSARTGTTIDMEDILTMQVWIPRYKYTVWNYNLSGSAGKNPQSIEITFEEGKDRTGEITCTDSITGTTGGVSETCKIGTTTCTDSTCNTKTYTHPAFTFGDDELTGFWVGKFENSHDGEENACEPADQDAPNTGCNVTTMNVRVVPNVTSWRGIQLGTSYTNIIEMNDEDNMYGFIENQDYTHMMKNMEWGAVAYLSHSKYGKNAELEMNTNSAYKTGCGPISSGDLTETTECSEYTTELGQGVSTTGNIYGIYDMSGGAWEQMMSAVISPDGASLIVGHTLETTGQYKYANSGFKGIVYDGGKYTNYTAGEYTLPIDTKYYDKYSFGTTYNDTAARKRSKLGDAIREVYNTETSGWYSDYSYFIGSGGPWFSRGGRAGNGVIAGVFSSTYSNGYANANDTSRLVISQP